MLDSARDMIERAYVGSAQQTADRGYPIVVQVVDRDEQEGQHGSGVDWFPRTPLAALVLILLWEVAKWAVTLLVSHGWMP